MYNEIQKAHAISDAKITFVSLVNKAANKKQFLIAKADGAGCADFQTFGKILKADGESHFVTGIVYEPMVEDSQGEYMTAEEITKAAHWFMKNGGDVDIQHCFEKADGVEVVESYVAKSDMEINGESVREGTWLMTMEVTDPAIWDAIEKGDITGFSMGGKANVSEEEVQLDLGGVEKAAEKTLFQKLAKALGYEVVKKGQMADTYRKRSREQNFYEAWNSLNEALNGYRYDEKSGTYTWGYENDEEVIREALTEFNEIVVGILAGDSVTKSLAKDAGKTGAKKPVAKAGKSISTKNLETLTGIYNSLSEFIASVTPDEGSEEPDEGDGSEAENGSANTITSKKEESDMKKSEVETLVQEAIAKAMQPIMEKVDAITKGDGEAAGGEQAGTDGNAVGSAPAEATPEDVSAAINDAVAKAVEPIEKQLEAIRNSRALPSNLNGSPEGVSKSEPHYLHGII